MSNGNLLIVDDEPILLKRLKLSLEEYAREIFTAQNGLEALEVLKQHEIHCVICDVSMPKMNGVELIKHIREEGNNVPFIFYTGHGSRELMLEVVKYGAFDFLDKPNFERLEDAVSRGLKFGFEGSSTTGTDDATLVSEYQKLLAELKDE